MVVAAALSYGVSAHASSSSGSINASGNQQRQPMELQQPDAKNESICEATVAKPSYFCYSKILLFSKSLSRRGSCCKSSCCCCRHWSPHHAEPRHANILGHMLYSAKVLAEKEGISEGYRVVINNGADACQSVYHLHLHIIGGRQMKWPPG